MKNIIDNAILMAKYMGRVRKTDILPDKNILYYFIKSKGGI